MKGKTMGKIDNSDIIQIIQDEENSGRKPGFKKKKKKTKKFKFKILALIMESLVILLLVGMLAMLLIPNAKSKLAGTWLGKFFITTMFTEDSWGKILDDNFDRDDTGVNEDLKVLDGYMNIALFGLDSRKGELESGIQSDTIMIVSINKETKQVKLASIYRDTYLRCLDKEGDFYYGKVNSAYNVGGAQGAVKTLNNNFDLDIKDYVTVNFNGIATIIDKLGGIDVTVTADEAEYVNGYLVETRKLTGMKSPDIAVKAGKVHLNGLQATAYCRIRYTAYYFEDGSHINDDYGRTARQRNVISKMIEKAKEAGMDEVLDMADEIFKDDSGIFLTSIPYDDIIDLIPILLEFSLGNQDGFPKTHISYNDEKWNQCVAPNDLATMVVDLHEFLFDKKNYKPSQTVIGINSTICKKVGIPVKYDPDEEETTAPKTTTKTK